MELRVQALRFEVSNSCGLGFRDLELDLRLSGGASFKFWNRGLGIWIWGSPVYGFGALGLGFSFSIGSEKAERVLPQKAAVWAQTSGHTW